MRRDQKRDKYEMRLRPSGRKAALGPIAAGSGEQLTVHDVRLIAIVLELPVRRLPYTASRGAALVFDGPDLDDACRPDGLDDGPVDGPGVDLDGIGEPAFAGGEGRELDRRRPARTD
ncbi:MAG: hypothetical protein METHAR1v1_650012, partial [Methanothrix sp.]